MIGAARRSRRLASLGVWGLLLAPALVAAPLPAPASSAQLQQPEDARALLERHQELQQREDLWPVESERFLLYYQAGALHEAQLAVSALERLTPGHADPQRFQLLLDAHQPLRLARTLEESDRFLQGHRDDDQVGAEVIASVQGLRDWLRAELDHRQEIGAATRRARWMPALGLLLVGALAWFLSRPPRS